MKHNLRTIRLSAQLALGLALAFPLVTVVGAEEASPASLAGAEKIGPIKLRDVSIDQVLELYERWTGRALLRPQALPTTAVSLNLKEEVTREQAIRAVETLLSLNGIALTPLDDHFVKVTPLNAAKSEAPELIQGSTLVLPPSGRIASKVFHLKFLRVAEFMPQIASQLNPAAGGAPAVFEKSNAALITDSISNLQRVELLMQQLDKPDTTGLQPKFYPLTYTKASDVVNKLKSMLTGPLQTQLGSATSYSAEDRTNQIVLFADPQQYPIFDQLIAKLDVRSGQDTRTEIIYLLHAAAKEVATLLSQLVSGQNNAARNSGQEAPRATAAAQPQPPPPVPSLGTVASTPSSPAPPSGAAAAIQPPSVVAPLGLALEATHQFSSLLTILPEDRSNSLIISGTEDDIRLIRGVVEKVDVLLAQVRIEVVIAEVSLSDNSTTGISELGLRVEGDKLTGFSARLPGVTVANGVITRPDGENTITGPWDLAAQITLAATPRKTSANLLSVPNIITTHNKEGRIFVGEQRPVISSYLNDGTVGAPGGAVGVGYRSTVSSKDIGIQLSVKPLIGPDGSVQLEIKQEVNDILGEITIDGNPQPRIGRRSTESFVSAKSGDIIVLGGLQRSSLSRNSSRLGPIPIIGDLLGSRSKEKTRTDLLFFLRPTVLTNPEKDNLAALRQIDALPKAPRQEINRAIGQPSAAR